METGRPCAKVNSINVGMSGKCPWEASSGGIITWSLLQVLYLWSEFMLETISLSTCQRPLNLWKYITYWTDTSHQSPSEVYIVGASLCNVCQSNQAPHLHVGPNKAHSVSGSISVTLKRSNGASVWAPLLSQSLPWHQKGAPSLLFVNKFVMLSC